MKMDRYKIEIVKLKNEDGGGYYRRYDYTWLWVTLIATVVLVVLLVLLYDPWYWY